MTSEEALEYLKKALNLANYPKGTAEDLLADDYAFSCLLQLSQDLEVLEILKKYLSYYSKSYYNNQVNYGYGEITLRLEQDNIWLNDERREQLKKDFNKVKEWLENDSQRSTKNN